MSFNKPDLTHTELIIAHSTICGGFGDTIHTCFIYFKYIPKRTKRNYILGHFHHMIERIRAGVDVKRAFLGSCMSSSWHFLPSCVQWVFWQVFTFCTPPSSVRTRHICSWGRGTLRRHSSHTHSATTWGSLIFRSWPVTRAIGVWLSQWFSLWASCCGAACWIRSPNPHGITTQLFPSIFQFLEWCGFIYFPMSSCY